MSTIVLERFANREYRLTLQDIVSRPKGGGDKYAEKQSERYAQAVLDTYVLQQNLKIGLMSAGSEQDTRVLPIQEWDVRRGIRALDIIDEFQQNARSRKSKGGWGFAAKPTIFTRNARHRLLEAGAVMDAECGHNTYEVTCTIPGSTREAFQVVADYSGWICNRLLQIVRRFTNPLHWFYVWERQKRGALHVHFAIGSSNISDVKKAACQLEYMWFELLLELGEKTGVDCFRKNRNFTWRNRPEKWQSHVSPINKSCAAYFSKYAGKSANAAQKSTGKYFPARWWGSSKLIKQGIELRRERYEFEGSNEYLKQVYDYLSHWLNDPSSIKTYAYDFNLGKSKEGTILGGGHVQISYYQDEGFIRMQNWESYVIEHCYHLGEFDADIDTLAYADIPPILRRHYKNITDRGAFTSPPLPPHNQPSSTVSSDVLQGVLRRQPTLAIRATLLQYLAGGGRDTVICTQTCANADMNADIERRHQTEYLQGELFNKNNYKRLTGW